MNPASATAIFAVILLTISTGQSTEVCCMHAPRTVLKFHFFSCAGALPIQDVQDQQEYPAISHKKPCPVGYEEYCLNGGKCFTVTVAGITTGPACQ